MWYWDQQTFLGSTFDVKIYDNGSDIDGILFVHHGSSRSTYSSGSDDIAELNNLAVYTPIFSEEEFNSREYQRGGITDSSGNVLPESEWTTRYEEPMLEWARSQYEEDKPVYLFGHSAGGQYLSRVAAYQGVPDYVDRIIIANPSTWVMPTLDEDAPYGFDGLGTPEEEMAALEAYLALPITVYLGSEDTDPNDPALATFEEAMRQGEMRLERGLNAYAMGEAVAAEHGWDFNWELVIAEGVGHSGSDMLRAPEMVEALDPVDEPLNGVPYDIALSDGTINEDAGAGTVVGHLTAEDPDGDTVIFEVVDDARFEVVDGNQLVTAAGADLAVQGDQVATVLIRADDQHGGTTVSEVQVVIRNVNQAPHDIALQDGTIREDAASGTVIGQLSAQDADGDHITFTVVDDPRFAVNDAGQLVIAEGAQIAVDRDQTDAVTVRAEDGQGGVALETVDVTILDADTPQNGDPIGEAGTVFVGQNDGDEWHKVTFSEALDNPSVVMGGLTNNGPQHTTLRVRNVTDTGFEFQLDEWDYQDGWHKVERVSWVAIEQGKHTLSNGLQIEAGSISHDGTLADINFADGYFAEAPTVLAQVASANDPRGVTDRVFNVDQDGFDLRLQNQENQPNWSHGTERIDWIAIQTGGAAGDGILSGQTETIVTHKRTALDFDGAFDSDGFAFIEDMQSFNGTDTASIRLASIDETGVDMFVEEERSADGEVRHAAEDVGFLAIQDGLIYDDSLLA